MAMRIIKQTIIQRNASFSKLLLMILGGMFSISIITRVLNTFSFLAGRIGGLIAFMAAIVGCIMILYKHVAYFNYRLIEDELIMEKVFGRANHLFLNAKLGEIDFFQPYHQAKAQGLQSKKTKVYRFVSGKNSSAWYVGEFLRNEERYRFIIEPNEELLKAIQSFIGNEQNGFPCCIR